MDMRPVPIRSNRDPLFGLSPAEVESFLAETLCGRVSQAYLFGSWGTETFGAHSDIDLMIVADVEGTFVERGLAFRDLRDRLPSLEILVYTPDEFKALTTDPSVGFWQSVTGSLKRVV